MAKRTTKKPTEDEVEPTVLEEPQADAEAAAPGWDKDDNVWLRGLWMLLFALFYRVGELVLGVSTVIQFFWLLFAKEKNAHIAGFGEDLADWLARTARFMTAATEARPFPFAKWGKAE